MLEHLFGSKTRYKLLRLFFRDLEKPLYVREMVREIETQINAVRRELALLHKLGILSILEEVPKEAGPKKKYFKLNKDSLLFLELQALLLKEDTMSEQTFIDTLKEKSGKPVLFLLSGCFTEDSKAETDMLLVGEINQKVVAKYISQYENEFAKQVRYTIMTEKEFSDRRHVMDKFLFGIFEAKHIKVLDELGI